MKLLNFFYVFLIIVFGSQLNAQDNKYTIHTLAFYNLENLFDTINDPLKLDEYSPIMELKTERSQAYNKKLHNMAKVLSNIGSDLNKNCPTIIGVCEIENRTVLNDLLNQPELIKKDYDIIHFDSPDARGIDVGLLYRTSFFTPTNSKTYTLKIYDELNGKRITTRDQLVVSGVLEDEDIYLIINHWPSRRGGEQRSKPKRMAAAKLNKHITDSIYAKAPDAKIVIMGDFNDNPTNASLKKVLQTQKKRKKVGFKGFYNDFENVFNNGFGTTAYRDNWSLFDQIIISKPLIEKDFSSYRFYKAGIYNKNYLITSNGKYKGYPFRSWNYAGFSNGYSDHFPVYIYLVKKNN